VTIDRSKFSGLRDIERRAQERTQGLADEVRNSQSATVEANADERRLTLHGGVGDVMYDHVAEKLEALGPGPVNVRINSSGGSLFAGFGIYNMLDEHDGEIMTQANALAASAASIIHLAGSVRTVARGGRIMIHRAAVLILAYMNAPQLRKEAEFLAGELEAADNEIAELIAERTNLSQEQAIAAMDRETWYTSAQAAKAGFTTKKSETKADGSDADLMTASHMIDRLRRMNAPEDVIRLIQDSEPPQPAPTTGADESASVNAIRADNIRRNWSRRSRYAGDIPGEDRLRT